MSRSSLSNIELRRLVVKHPLIRERVLSWSNLSEHELFLYKNRSLLRQIVVRAMYDLEMAIPHKDCCHEDITLGTDDLGEPLNWSSYSDGKGISFFVNGEPVPLWRQELAVWCDPHGSLPGR